MEKLQTALLVLVYAGLMSTKLAMAAQHVVGGNQGWAESVDMNSWSSGETFKVGDQLVFKYTTGLHSVAEVGSESAYKSCDLGTTLNTMNTGKDVVKLTKPGTRYFMCGTPGHCDQGMKVKIITVSSDSSPSPSSSPSSPSSSSSSDTSATAGISHGLKPPLGVTIISVVIVIMSVARAV